MYCHRIIRLLSYTPKITSLYFPVICSHCKRSVDWSRVSSLRFPKTQMVLTSACMGLSLTGPHTNAVFSSGCTNVYTRMRTEGTTRFRVDKWVRGWIHEEECDAAPGEKIKDTLGDAENEKTKKRSEYISWFWATGETKTLPCIVDCT